MSENRNPTLADLREMVQSMDSFEISSFGAFVVQTSTTQPSTLLDLNDDMMPLAESIEDSLCEDSIVIDGQICPSPGNTLHVRLEVPASYPSLALFFNMATYQNRMTKNDTFQDPDVVVYCNPDLPVGKIKHVNSGGFTRVKDNSAVVVGDGVAYVSGSDLFEDVMTALMRSVARNIANRGGALLPGAIKELKSIHRKNDKKVCIIGQPGTGVTRTAFGGERSGLCQDGFVQIMRLGVFYPVMNISYADVNGLSTVCPALDRVVKTGDCFLENALMDNGYANLEESENARAVIGIGSVGNNVRVDRLEGSDMFVLLVKDEGVIPGVTKVDADQFVAHACAYADDWSLSSKEVENLLYSLRFAPAFEGYIINTGTVAEGKGEITEASVQSILTYITKDSIKWKHDRVMGWDYCPHQILDCDTNTLIPERAFLEDVRGNEYKARVRIHIDGTRELLRDKYPDLPEAIYSAIAKPTPPTEIENLHRESVDRGEKVFQHPVTGEAILTELAHWGRGWCCNDNCTFCPFR